MKRITAILLAIVMIFSLAACGNEKSGEETKESYKIGWFSPLTGTAATQGNAAHDAAQLYVKELNERGGLLGLPVELVVYDDVADTEQAVKIATKLVEVDQVDFVISSIISNFSIK